MRVFLVDDEQPSLDELVWRLRKYPDIEIAGTFTDPASALKAAGESRPDAAFLDIDMPGLTGLELALRTQAQCPGVIVIFVTAHAQYALEAYKSFPLDFLLKPVKEARLDETIEHLRAQHKLLNRASAPESRMKIRCFGAFELLAAEEAKWETRRVRELFLYLIDLRGAAPTKEEMLYAFFDGHNDKATANNLYMTIYRLRKLLSELDAEGKYIRMADDYSLTVAPGVCDYTDFMAFAQSSAVTGKNVAEAARMLALCRGPYLEKEPFEWAAESAREAEVEYERIALELAGCHAAAGRVPEAENALCALLARNPLSAEGCEALLDLYMSGNRTAYCERYEQYARLMKKEFRLTPQEEYREYYERVKRAR
jgi:two-component SAPR family response regulator